MRSLLIPAALTLAACSHTPPSDPADISQYVCPNGQTLRVSLSQDLNTMRLTRVDDRSYTLTRQGEEGLTYSNSYYTARLEQHQLHLTTAGKLLPEHCQLQIPATPEAPTPPAG